MARSPDDLRKTGLIHPTLAQAIHTRPFPDLPIDPLEHRKFRAAHLQRLRHLMPVPGPIPDQVIEQELLVPARDKYKIRVIHYKPVEKTPSPPPLVVLLHEGGWCEGDSTDEEFNARLLVRELGVVCLNVEYRLAPEHLFPKGIEDCWDVLVWASQNSSLLEADLDKGFIVGGSSAGGNLAAILALMSRSRGLEPPVTGQWLGVPWLFPSKALPDWYKPELLSMKENTNDPILCDGLDAEKEEMVLKSVGADPDSPFLSVLASDYYPPSKDDLKKKGPVAKAFIQVAGMDPLRDQGLVYDRILREDFRSETRVKIYSGFGHMFWTNWPELEVSKQFSRDMLDGFRWLLSM